MNRHARKGTARQEELDPSLNPTSAALRRDSRTTTNILEGDDEFSLMYPQPTEKNFDNAYARAATLQQKITVITRAIEHFYPLISQQQRLSGAKLRLPMTNSLLELQKWIKKSDELWTVAEKKIEMQVIILPTMQDCWEKYKSSTSLDKTPKSMIQISVASTVETESDFFVAETETKSHVMTSLATDEWIKWKLRQQPEEAALDSASAQSSCCIIL